MSTLADKLPPTGRTNWAAPSTAKPDLMAAFQDGLPVRLIATRREDLVTCRINEAVAEVVARREGFDFYPVVDEVGGRIVGLLEATPTLADAGGLVRDRMAALSEENLIGADAGILAFIRQADTRTCRLVVSGAQISGLATLSDLQRLPARAALFALVTHLEMILVEAIRREFGESDAWKSRLSLGRLEKLNRNIADAKKEDTLVDDLLLSELADKVAIVRKGPVAAASRSGFKEAMEHARRLRDNLAHANEYAATVKAALQVCKTVRIIEAWIDHIGAYV